MQLSLLIRYEAILHIGRPKLIVNREAVLRDRQRGFSIRQLAKMQPSGSFPVTYATRTSTATFRDKSPAAKQLLRPLISLRVIQSSATGFERTHGARHWNRHHCPSLPLPS